MSDNAITPLTTRWRVSAVVPDAVPHPQVADRQLRTVRAVDDHRHRTFGDEADRVRHGVSPLYRLALRVHRGNSHEPPWWPQCLVVEAERTGHEPQLGIDILRGVSRCELSAPSRCSPARCAAYQARCWSSLGFRRAFVCRRGGSERTPGSRSRRGRTPLPGSLGSFARQLVSDGEQGL